MAIDAQANLRTLRDVLRFAVSRFNQSGLYFGHGQIDAFDEAAFMIMRALHLPIERLEPFLDAFLTHAEINSLIELIDRRVKRRIPAAYLLQEAWLQGYKFYIDDRAIIPRSFIAELLKEELSPWVQDPLAVTDVLDLCTGSGCLAVIAADAFPRARVHAVDVSAEALAVARRNVDDYGLQQRIELFQSDLFAALPITQRYDLILCNPPYVPDASMARLPREYTREPQMALAGGPDGMDVIRRVLDDARNHIKRGGLLVIECGGERLAVERTVDPMPVTWLATSGGEDMVFLVQQEDLL